jgi:hypothetical protein
MACGEPGHIREESHQLQLRHHHLYLENILLRNFVRVDAERTKRFASPIDHSQVPALEKATLRC